MKVWDCYLTQLNHHITRIMGDNVGNTLDSLFCSEGSIREDITVESPLGKSDHSCIIFRVDSEELQLSRKRKIYAYEKAN